MPHYGCNAVNFCQISVLPVLKSRKQKNFDFSASVTNTPVFMPKPVTGVTSRGTAVHQKQRI
jgi:hypothetical protein